MKRKPADLPDPTSGSRGGGSTFETTVVSFLLVIMSCLAAPHGVWSGGWIPLEFSVLFLVTTGHDSPTLMLLLPTYFDGLLYIDRPDKTIGRGTNRTLPPVPLHFPAPSSSSTFSRMFGMLYLIYVYVCIYMCV